MTPGPQSVAIVLRGGQIQRITGGKADNLPVVNNNITLLKIF